MLVVVIKGDKTATLVVWLRIREEVILRGQFEGLSAINLFTHFRARLLFHRRIHNSFR